MTLNATNLDYRTLNQKILQAGTEISVINCCGQRFIATGMKNNRIVIHGVPGNALGSYLDGASIEVFSNAQDAVGDTMNNGKIIIHGNIGDAAGYAMRGGKLYIKGNAGYRTGIHMKEYQDKIPVMIIGGFAGSFLGEYQAGGVIIVLGINRANHPIIGNFPCTGMHGGKIFLRGTPTEITFPPNVHVQSASSAMMELIQSDLADYCRIFGFDENEIRNSPFTVITPDSQNPYRQMYVAN